MNQVDEIIPRMMLFASPLSRVPRACFCPLAVKFLPEVRGIAEAIAFGTPELIRLNHVFKLGTLQQFNEKKKAIAEKEENKEKIRRRYHRD